jgi:predicted nuclease with TOPRIM domain
LFSLSLHEKIDLQEVEINEQTIVIDELRNEIRRLNDHQNEPIRSLSITIPSNDEQNQLIEKLDKKLYELETERTNLIFEQERLKTNYDLCIDEKQHLIEQKIQINNEFKKSKLRILALQDQIKKLKRNNKNDLIPILTIKRRTIKKKPKKSINTKSCLEMLLDQNATFIDDLQNESFISNKRSYHICNHLNEKSLIKRKRRPSISSTISKTRCSLLIFFV